MPSFEPSTTQFHDYITSTGMEGRCEACGTYADNPIHRVPRTLREDAMSKPEERWALPPRELIQLAYGLRGKLVVEQINRRIEFTILGEPLPMGEYEAITKVRKEAANAPQT